MKIEVLSTSVDTTTYLYPSLKFKLRLTNDHSQDVTTLCYTGWITAVRRRVEEIPYMYSKHEMHPGEIFDNNYVFLVCPPEKIFEIERLRNGRDFVLSISTEIQFGSSNRSGTPKNISRQTASVEIPISQSQWGKYLEQMGYGERRIVEVPNPKILNVQPLASGIKMMEEAYTLLKQGQHEGAFNKCRLALDEIYIVFNQSSAPTPVKFDNEIKDTIDKGSKPAPKPDGNSHPNKSTYINNLRKHIREYSHLSHHGTYKITPEDAEFVVYLCWDLISYLSKQLAIVNRQWPKP